MNVGDILIIKCDRVPLWITTLIEQNFNSMWAELNENDVVFFLESRSLEGFGNLKLNYFKVITDTGRIGWIWEKNTKQL